MSCRMSGCVVLLAAVWTLHAATRPIDPTSFVAVGGGWTAGYADSRLASGYQQFSYPSLMARQMGTIMPLARFRPMDGPLIAGVDLLPGIAPPVSQSTLRALPFPVFTFNLSIPYLTAAESLRRRPEPPVQREGDLKQTLINLVLGYPALLFDAVPLWTQIEYAERMRPTFVIWQPGEGDLLPAVLTGDPSATTPLTSFATDINEAASRLRSTHAQVVVLNLPNPFDAAFFSSLEEVAESYDLTIAELGAVFGLAGGDRVTLVGLVEIAEFYRGRGTGQLSAGAVVKGPDVEAIQVELSGLNGVIEHAAAQHGFQLFDLHGFARTVRVSGIEAGGLTLRGRLGGGFYSPDGLFPSPSGQATLAGQLISFLNRVFRTSYPPVDVEAILEQDPFLPGMGDGDLSPVEGRDRRLLPSARGFAPTKGGTP